MAAFERSTISGASELNAVLRKLPKEIGQKVLLSSLRAGANVIKKEAIIRAPASGLGAEKRRKRSSSGEDYGTLKSNIKATVTAKSADSVTIKVHRGAAFWGQFLEFGTVNMPARPWLRPAFDATKGKAVDVIGKRLGKNVEKAAEKLAGSFATSGLKKKRRRS